MRLYSCLISTLLGLTMFCSAASQQILPSDTMVQTRNKLNSNFTNLDTASTNYATIAQGAKADAAVPSTTSVNVKAWGANGDGQTNVPATVIDARAISLGYGHGLALLSTGRVTLEQLIEITSDSENSIASYQLIGAKIVSRVWYPSSRLPVISSPRLIFAKDLTVKEGIECIKFYEENSACS